MQGRAMLKQLEKRNDWDIVAISRGPVPGLNSRARFISLDLKDKQVKNHLSAHLKQWDVHIDDRSDLARRLWRPNCGRRRSLA